MKKLIFFTVFVLTTIWGYSQQLTSPNGNFQLNFSLNTVNLFISSLIRGKR